MNSEESGNQQLESDQHAYEHIDECVAEIMLSDCTPQNHALNQVSKAKHDAKNDELRDSNTEMHPQEDLKLAFEVVAFLCQRQVRCLQKSL